MRASRPRLLLLISAHPVITGVMIGCTLLGAVIGVALFNPDWSLARRLAAGLLSGAGCGLIITTPRMIG